LFHPHHAAATAKFRDATNRAARRFGGFRARLLRAERR
jgi:hypothetical protein